MSSTPDPSTSLQPLWKQLKLSFERPYKDDQGNRLPTLLDLTPDGQQIYEPKETSSSRLETNLRRIFLERGTDFFDRPEPSRLKNDNLARQLESGTVKLDDVDIIGSKSMSLEELYEMRMEILPHLIVALGEMTHAQALLTSVLAGTQPEETRADSVPSMSTTLITKPSPVLSVQAFNAQLTIGSKDEALRKAASLFKSAAESMERGRLRGEKYWEDALRIRKSNWGLIPAPLPLGSSTGKGADKTSRDFIISYGLEGSSPSFRRRAIARLGTHLDSHDDLDFPFHQRTRLRITISITMETGSQLSVFSSPLCSMAHDLDHALQAAQTEVVDQEIFSILVKEAANLPTAPARISERLIAVDAAQGVDLTFSLVDVTTFPDNKDRNESKGTLGSLIYHVLRVLLVQTRRLSQGAMSNNATSGVDSSSSILRPIVDALQYRVFCGRIRLQLQKAAHALDTVGIPSNLAFTAVGEYGQELVTLLCNRGAKTLGGEAVLRFDTWHSLRFTFISPSSLTAHLTHATLIVTSLPQLTQLLMDEIEKSLLRKICELGKERCGNNGGIWFIDLNRCVAKWEGCVMNFCITYGPDFSIRCSVFRLDRTTGKQGISQDYSGSEIALFSWLAAIMDSTTQVQK